MKNSFRIPKRNFSKKKLKFSIEFHRFLSTNMSEDLTVLAGTVDRYNGITIDTENEVIGDEFANRLQSKMIPTHLYTMFNAC